MSHIPVLLAEVLQHLDVQPDGVYIDGTFGRGGHSTAILQKISHGKLIAFDKDTEAKNSIAPSLLADPRFTFVQAPFSGIAAYLQEHNLKANGILLDIGVSSPQIDTAERGFSYRMEGPLDMRMDQTQGQTAAEWLNTAPEDHISRVLWEFGEEKFSRKIARNICNARTQKPLATTNDLIYIVQSSIPKRFQDKNPAVRTFQAIRIFINNEMQELETALKTLPNCLTPGGVLAIISFHSLEDRRVKKAFQELTLAPNLPNVPLSITMPYQTFKKIKASEKELTQNPRAHSATLRILQRRKDVALKNQS